jgi:hypothetical protein
VPSLSRAVPWLLVLAACGDDGPTTTPPDSTTVDARPDAPPSSCLPLPAMGQLTRRAGNPRLLPGVPFLDGKLSTAISDPDVRWDAAASRYQLYYTAPHATSFAGPSELLIRHATSPDRMTWTVDDAPVFAPSPDPDAWDHSRAEAVSVIYNPDAPADRRYLMLYAGAARTFPFPGYTFPEYAIGAAFSADGIAFTRVPAAQSPHARDGLVITGKQVYGAATGAIVTDPELALVGGVYHLFFSSYACDGATCANPTDRGVGHATSADGITWTVVESPVRSLLRASIDRKTGGQQPSVIYDAEHCRWELWLTSDLPGENDVQPTELDNMMGVYLADSSDGATWHISYPSQRDVRWTVAEAGEHLGLEGGVDVAQNAGGRLMLYVGYDDQNIPSEFTLPDRTPAGSRPGVTALNVATRDLP